MSDDTTKEIIPGSWRRIIRDEVWENLERELAEVNTVSATLLTTKCRELAEVTKQRDALIEGLEKIASLDFVIKLPDRMDAVRNIANETLNKLKP